MKMPKYKITHETKGENKTVVIEGETLKDALTAYCEECIDNDDTGNFFETEHADMEYFCDRKDFYQVEAYGKTYGIIIEDVSEIGEGSGSENGGAGEALKERLKTEKRYEGFTVLDAPAVFRTLFAGQDAQTVQLHSIDPCGDGIVGFYGVCSWIGSKIASLDGDSYSDDMDVYGYKWFKDRNGANCLDILVEENW